MSGRTAKQPRMPPIREISSDSNINDRMTDPPPNPRARIVAISRARAATAEYMVLRAPKTAPIAITKATRKPSTLINVLTIRDCRS